MREENKNLQHHCIMITTRIHLQVFRNNNNEHWAFLGCGISQFRTIHFPASFPPHLLLTPTTSAFIICYSHVHTHVVNNKVTFTFLIFLLSKPVSLWLQRLNQEQRRSRKRLLKVPHVVCKSLVVDTCACEALALVSIFKTKISHDVVRHDWHFCIVCYYSYYYDLQKCWSKRFMKRMW